MDNAIEPLAPPLQAALVVIAAPIVLEYASACQANFCSGAFALLQRQHAYGVN